MDAYIYEAALWCEDCTNGIKARIQPPPHHDPDDEHSFDSGEYPKGPYSDGGGEADTPQHCDGCNVFLENPLTSDGDRYVQEQVASARKRLAAMTPWIDFYDHLNLTETA